MSRNEKQLIRFLISALAVFLTGIVLPGVDVSNVLIAIVIAAFLELMNAFVKPILVLLTLPVTIFTLGLFLIVINGIIITLIDYLIPKEYFQLRNFWSAILFSLVYTIFTTLIQRMVGIREDENPRR